MACTTCGQKRRGVGADAPARRTRVETQNIASLPVTVQLGAAVLPVNVLLPMRLLAYQAGRKLLIHLPTTELPRPIAEWLVGRFPGHVVIVETRVQTQYFASVLPSVPTKKKKASKPR